VNVDSGSIYDSFDFTDPLLTALTSHLSRAAPTQLRVGGGAADNVLFTGAGGARGACPGAAPGVDVCINAASWDELNAFAGAARVQLVFDLNLAALRDAAGAWDPTNARALFAHAAASATPCAVVAWQLGNEPQDYYKRHPPFNITGAALAADYATLRRELAAFPSLAQTVYGPDACCEERRPVLAAFSAAAAAAAPPLVDAVTVHAYPIARAPDDACLAPLYTDLAAMRTLGASLAAYAAAARPLLARGVPLVLGETATSAHGGCANLSNAFVAGFTFMHELGSVGEAGVAQLNRQDLAGFSSEGEGSNYALLGPAGWARGPLGAPHPDFFTALLWKHAVGTVVLASNATSTDPGAAAGFDAHVWCAAAGGGVAVVSFVNLLGRAVALALPAAVASARRVEYVLTATARPADAPAPPPELFGNDVYLNGARLGVDAAGEVLPAWPLPGRDADGPIQVPAWSYGLITLLDAGAHGACVGCAGGRCP